MYPRPCLYHFNVSNMTLLGQKRYRDGDTIHYNCTIGSILLHSFLLICHPYPPSFHEMIFTLVYIKYLASITRADKNSDFVPVIGFLLSYSDGNHDTCMPRDMGVDVATYNSTYNGCGLQLHQNCSHRFYEMLYLVVRMLFLHSIIKH